MLSITAGYNIVPDHSFIPSFLIVHPLYAIFDLDIAALYHPSGDPAVSANCIVAARPQRLLHPAARRALSTAFEKRVADPETSILQRHQVDAPCDEISAKEFRRDFSKPKECSRRSHVLGRDQRNLSRTVPVRIVTVADDPVAGDQRRRRTGLDGNSPPGAHADPLQPTRTHRTGEQSAKGRVWGERHCYPLTSRTLASCPKVLMRATSCRFPRKTKACLHSLSASKLHNQRE
jgi:hypothetical protein